MTDQVLEKLLDFNSLLNSVTKGVVSLEQIEIFYRFLSQVEKVSFLIWQLYINFMSTYRDGRFVPVSNQDVIQSYMTGSRLVLVSSFPAGFVSLLNTQFEPEINTDNQQLIDLLDQYNSTVASIPREAEESNDDLD